MPKAARGFVGSAVDLACLVTQPQDHVPSLDGFRLPRYLHFDDGRVIGPEFAQLREAPEVGVSTLVRPEDGPPFYWLSWLDHHSRFVYGPRGLPPHPEEDRVGSMGRYEDPTRLGVDVAECGAPCLLVHGLYRSLIDEPAAAAVLRPPVSEELEGVVSTLKPPYRRQGTDYPPHILISDGGGSVLIHQLHGLSDRYDALDHTLGETPQPFRNLSDNEDDTRIRVGALEVCKGLHGLHHRPLDGPLEPRVYLRTKADGAISPRLPGNVWVQPQEVRVVDEDGAQPKKLLNEPRRYVGGAAPPWRIGVVYAHVQEQADVPSQMGWKPTIIKLNDNLTHLSQRMRCFKAYQYSISNFPIFGIPF